MCGATFASFDLERKFEFFVVGEEKRETHF